jgi:hypothetical protein
VNAVTALCFALVVVAGAAPCAAVSAQVGAVPRDSGPVFPATAKGTISSMAPFTSFRVTTLVPQGDNVGSRSHSSRSSSPSTVAPSAEEGMANPIGHAESSSLASVVGSTDSS